MRDLDLLIAEAIEKSETDQYGQYIRMNTTIYNLFRNEDDEFRKKVEAHLKSGESKYVLQCYGWKYGTYYAVNPYPKNN